MSDDHQNQPKRRTSDYEATMISKAEMRDMFREEGAKLIADTFSLVGVDIKSQDARNSLRDDFVWVRGARTAAADTAKTVRRSLIGLGVTGGIGAIWAAIKLKAGAP